MLKCKRIHLRLLEREDIPQRTVWMNDKEINRMLILDWPISLTKSQKWFDTAINDNSKIHFVIIDNEMNRLIGVAGLVDINTRDRHAEVYLIIGEKNYWGKGIATEVLNLLIEYSFEYLGIKRLYGYNFSYNIASQKMLEKVGFIKEGIMRKHIYKNGKLEDINIYGLLKDELEY